VLQGAHQVRTAEVADLISMCFQCDTVVAVSFRQTTDSMLPEKPIRLDTRDYPLGYNPSHKCLESPKPNSDRLAFVVQLPGGPSERSRWRGGRCRV